MMLMGFGLLGLLGSDNIRCLFMPAWLVWLMPRMGFGLADERACHDAGSREDIMPLGWMLWRCRG
jgi:hypothetical protein